MNLRPEIRTRARGDMVRQFRWYCKQSSVENADRFMATVDAEIARLSERPHLGVRCRFPGTGLHYRDYHFIPLPIPYEVFVLFYRCDATTLSVMRVLHSARDIPRRLGEEAAVYGIAAANIQAANS